MAVYEKKWWRNLFGEKKQKQEISVIKDIKAIIEFLDYVKNDQESLLAELKKLEELEKEYKVASSGIVQINLETQAEIIERILQRYESFQNDVDINGLRVKMIANEFLTQASKAGMKDLATEKKKDIKWKFQW